MIDVDLFVAWFAAQYLGIARRVTGSERDRGDVPGWVMVTVMTAALVVAILGVFRTKITDAVTHAIDSVTSK